MSENINRNEQIASKDLSYLHQKLLFLYKKIWVIALAIVVGACFGLGINKLFVKPTYTASATVLLIANLDDSTSSSSAQTNATLAQLFLPETAMLIRSPAYINKANDKIQQMEVGTVRAGAIGIEVNDTLIFNITYTDATEEGAKLKLQAVIATAEENLTDPLIGIQASNVKLQPMYNDGAIRIAQNTSITKYIVVGAIVGLIASVVVLLFINALDNTVRSKEDLEELTGVSVVAYIEDREIFANAKKK